MHHKNHQTHSYPADKPIPLSLFRISKRARRFLEQNGLEAHKPSPAQRKTLKRQHNRRARQHRKQLGDYS